MLDFLCCCSEVRENNFMYFTLSKACQNSAAIVVNKFYRSFNFTGSNRDLLVPVNILTSYFTV